ncbi:hypothetical protein XA68_13019 [Ophiocordyceps unilateralis]|uniref:FAD-binding domain-containing protein n=1 Tax=Ophiocordyceps unilateralis TaxID=268505 RepID=A0A2A9PDH8_OPHUN|nr:hypothetical protein XA68_13019 [Ophiocordyceps unilateralis]
MSQNRFKVIIVGGSITGLTLAHSLHQIGVDYIILEKRPRVVLQEGASIGILPNGARILDQLGLYSSIEQTTGSLGASDIYFPDGFHFSSPYPTRVLESFGYPISFMERRRLLEILYNALPDKTKIHTKKEVISVEPDAIEEKSSIRSNSGRNVAHGESVRQSRDDNERTKNYVGRIFMLFWYLRRSC